MASSPISKAADAAGETIVKEIHKSLDKGVSPVEGGSYKRKLADGRRISRLLDQGNMRAYITYDQTAMGVKVGIFKTAPRIERLKASGHNQGDSITRIQREFIPKKGDFFKEKIIKKATRKAQEIFNATRTALDAKDGS